MSHAARRSFNGQQSRFHGAKKGEKDRGWDPVAAWYDKLVGESGSDYHQQVILPAVIRVLALKPGESVLDFCCGQGVLIGPLLAAKVGKFMGVDASPKLIESAKSRYGREAQVSLKVADACLPGSWVDGSYDAVTCIMAVHDVPDVAGMFRNMAGSLKQGGRVVLVLMHPCFRIPRKTHWGWDADQKVQYRRLDGYGTPLEIPITTHPGKGGGELTNFYHRPLAELLTSIGQAGLGVVCCEELYSHRRSQSGPFSKAEHRAAEEFPMFLLLTAVKLASVGGKVRE